MNFNTLYRNLLESITALEYRKADKGFAVGTPIIVIDIKTGKSHEFSSISEAARYFNTYPKTIWRVVYGNKLYHSRYKIIASGNKFKILIKYKYLLYRVIKNNSYFLFYIFLWLVFIVILYIFVYKAIIVFKEIYNDYIYNVHCIRINKKHLLEYNTDISSNLLYSDYLNINNSKISRFVEADERWKAKVKLGFYHKIMREVNLDFNSAINVAIINPVPSINSSPIIERIDLNSVFNTMVINTAPIIESMDSNFLSINSNRNSLTLNTSIDLLRGHPRNKELLNYESNILYLLINNLSPSIY